MTLPLNFFRQNKEFAHIEKDPSKWKEEAEFIGLRNRSVRKSSYIQSEHSKGTDETSLSIRTTNDFNPKWPVVGLLCAGVASVIIYSNYSQNTLPAITECVRVYEVSLPPI